MAAKKSRLKMRVLPAIVRASLREYDSRRIIWARSRSRASWAA